MRERSSPPPGFMGGRGEELGVLRAEIKALEEEAGLAAEAIPAPRGGKQ